MSHLKKILLNTLRLILLLALLLFYGGGSTILQGVAWVSMFTDELSNEASVTQALERTFDGEKPCHLCHAASKLRHGEHGIPNPKDNEPKPFKPTPKKPSDVFVFAKIALPKVNVSECDRGWIEFSKPWLSRLIVDVVTPPPQLV